MQHSRRPSNRPPPVPAGSHTRSPSASSVSSTSSTSVQQRMANNFTHFSNSSTSTIKLVPPSTPGVSPRNPPTIHASPGAAGSVRPGYFEPTLTTSHPPSGTPVPSQGPSQVAAAYAMQASQRKRSSTDPSSSSPPNYPIMTSPAGAAANAVFQRDRDVSPIGTAIPHPPPPPPSLANPPTLKKESSKMKLFSKPISTRIGTPTGDKKDHRPPPSPNKISHISSPIPRLAPSASSSSIAMQDNRRPSFSSMHSAASTTTLVNTSGDSYYSTSPPTKETKEHSHSHKPHFLRPRKDHGGVTFSSSSSNSKAVSSDGTSLYSFGPSSPSSTVFSSKADLQKTISNIDITGSDKKNKGAKGASSWEDGNFEAAIAAGSVGENAWSVLTGKLLGLFVGEPLKNTVEDLNKIVALHIRRCVERRQPVQLIEDVKDLLEMGMLNIDPNLPDYPDDRLMQRLVEIWRVMFGYTLPYLEAVFLPLQMEFKGVGSVMSSRESRDFFSGIQENLDVRRLVLVAFRDVVVLPLYSRLRILFSKMQLDFEVVSQSQATETVSRMLQCVSVLGSALTGDERQDMVDELAKSLKHNWLSRGRTGRNRRGFVGAKTVVGLGM